MIRGHEVNEGFFVTGFLVPLTLPPTIPLWQVALGVAFCVIVGKEIFGGTGMNFLNPALTVRAFLFFAYPAEISGDGLLSWGLDPPKRGALSGQHGSSWREWICRRLAAALVETLEWLQKRPEVQALGRQIEIPASLRDWIAEESKLGNPVLEAKVQQTNDPDLKRALQWSMAVNEAIADMVRGVPPFPWVRESLQQLAQTAGRPATRPMTGLPSVHRGLSETERRLAGWRPPECGQARARDSGAGSWHSCETRRAGERRQVGCLAGAA